MCHCMSISQCSFSPSKSPSLSSSFGTLKVDINWFRSLGLDIHEAVHKLFTMQLFTNQKSILFILYLWHSIHWFGYLGLDIHKHKSFHKHFTMRRFAYYNSGISVSKCVSLAKFYRYHLIFTTFAQKF